MIRDPEIAKLKIDVYVKTGPIYKNCDITSSPMGQHERVISFWHDSRVYVYPLDRIDHYEFHEEED